MQTGDFQGLAAKFGQNTNLQWTIAPSNFNIFARSKDEFNTNFGLLFNPELSVWQKKSSVKLENCF